MLNQGNMNKLQVLQNKAISISYSMPKGTMIKELHEISNMKMINDYGFYTAF